MPIPGITIIEATAGGAPPDNRQENKIGLITTHPTLRGLFLLGAATDVAATFGVNPQITAVQLNGGPLLNGAVYFAATIDATNVAAHIDDLILQLGTGSVSMIGIDADATAAMVAAVNAKLILLENAKEDYEIIYRYRKAFEAALGTVAYTQATGSVTIPLAGHPFVINDDVLIRGTGALDGRHNITAVVAGVSITIVSVVASGVFAGGTLKEHPEDYFLDMDTEFGLSGSNRANMIGGYTQVNYLGAMLGRYAAIPVNTSPIDRRLGSMAGVVVDTEMSKAALDYADGARFISFLHPRKGDTRVFPTNDLTLFPTADKVTSMPSRRELNKAKRIVYFYGDLLLGSDQYDRDTQGAKAAAMFLATGSDANPGGLKAMVEANEITAFDVSLVWVGIGSFTASLAITDRNRIKQELVNITINPPV